MNVKESPTEIVVTMDFVLTLDLPKRTHLPPSRTSSPSSVLNRRCSKRWLKTSTSTSLRRTAVKNTYKETVPSDINAQLRRIEQPLLPLVTTSFHLATSRTLQQLKARKRIFALSTKSLISTGRSDIRRISPHEQLILRQRFSYRDAAAHVDELERTPSKDTIRDPTD